MKAAWALWRRECAAFFLSPHAYVVLVVFLSIAGLNFWKLAVEGMNEGVQLPVLMFGPVFFWLMVLMVAAVVTMRLFAEERRTGTIDVLATAPVRDIDLVMGKYGAGLTCLLAVVMPTAAYPLLLRALSLDMTPIDGGQLAAGFGGLALIGAFYVALGLLVSALTSSQFVAVIATLALSCLVFFVESFWVAGAGAAPERVLASVSAIQHVADFAGGILDSRAIVFYLSGTALALFATVRVLAWRRCR